MVFKISLEELNAVGIKFEISNYRFINNFVDMI